MSSTVAIDLTTPPPPSTKYKSPLSKARHGPVASRRLGNRKLVKPKSVDDWISDDGEEEEETESRFVPAITPNQLKTPARKVSRLQSAKDREIQRLKEEIKLKDAGIARLKAMTSGKVPKKLLRKAAPDILSNTPDILPDTRIIFAVDIIDFIPVPIRTLRHRLPHKHLHSTIDRLRNQPRKLKTPVGYEHPLVGNK
ncbi:hypothetical protein K440DRAFT_658855 [Wilcoxina mikolae CBS 423.85]|nr:hypothetical protein K440DRAFT_658855 [Wilcoxina mikolae CBS 423.85]